MEIPYADAATISIALREVLSPQRRIVPTTSAPVRPLAPSSTLRLQTCRSAHNGTISPRSRTLILLATTQHGPTVGNIATATDYYPRNQYARAPKAQSNTLRLRTCRSECNGTFSWRSRAQMLLPLALPDGG